MMREDKTVKKFLTILACAGALFCNAVLADEMAKATAMAHFVNPDGDMIGDAKLWQGPQGVVILVQLSGLEPGKHAIHLSLIHISEPTRPY